MTQVPAPELPRTLEWLNASAVRLSDLRGRVIALGFWSAGSAYSHNLLDDLQRLQAHFADGLVVVAIHTPKFPAERDADLVRSTFRLHRWRFPVAHDPHFAVWQHYDVRAWPSVALIDADGMLVEVQAGDLQRAELEARVAALLDEAAARGRRVFHIADDAAPMPSDTARALACPSGIAVHASRLYVADTGHHRILECTFEGRVLRQFGSGAAGFLDGSRDVASLQAPRGLAVVRDALYVADSGNHAVRRIRLLDGEVETLAGHGTPGLTQASAGARAQALALNAPWDVAGNGERLFIALAGNQQIWEFDLARDALRLVAGSGRLALADGAGAAAAFAQPAGLALVQSTLYVADSAASALRCVNTDTGTVATLAGQGLFEFGLEDGGRSAARMQYPLGIAADPETQCLWITDAYNDRLRLLRPDRGELEQVDVPHRLRQPAAVAFADGALWIANTGAHEVLRFEPSTGRVLRVPVGE